MKNFLLLFISVVLATGVKSQSTEYFLSSGKLLSCYSNFTLITKVTTNVKDNIMTLKFGECNQIYSFKKYYDINDSVRIYTDFNAYNLIIEKNSSIYFYAITNKSFLFGGNIDQKIAKSHSIKKQQKKLNVYLEKLEEAKLKEKKYEEICVKFDKKQYSIDTISKGDLIDFYSYVKQSSYYKFGDGNEDFIKRRKRTLIQLTINSLSRKDLDESLVLEMMDFIGSYISKQIIYGKFTITLLKRGDKYDLAETKLDPNRPRYIELLLDENEPKRENEYKNFKNNPSSFSSEKLTELKNNFTIEKEFYKSSIILLELIKRDSLNKELNLMFVENLKNMQNELYALFNSKFNDRIKAIVGNNSNNEEFRVNYANMLIKHDDYKSAHDYLESGSNKKETKEILFKCKVNLFDIDVAVDYALNVNIPADSINEFLHYKSWSYSPEKQLQLTEFLYKNYKGNLDSIDISVFSNQLHKLSNLKDIEKVLKIYNDLGYDYLAFIIEYDYWWGRQLKVDDYVKSIQKKELSAPVGGAIIKETGYYWVLEACRPSNWVGGVNRELLNEAIKMLHKSESYLKCDGDLYKKLGDSYSFQGNANKKEYYYGLAENCGENMGDRKGGGGKGTNTGKRGGKYYINSNGNKTYTK